MSRRFTLFHLDSEKGLRGGERQLLYLAAGLRALGQENVIVCRRGFPLDLEAQRQGFERLHLPFLGEWDPWSALRLRRAAGRRPGAILHAHTAHTAALARLAGLFGGPPWVAHRRVDFRLSGALSRRLKYSGARRIVAVSRSVREILLKDGLPPERVEVVPDCLPENSLRPPAPHERMESRLRLGREWSLPTEGPWIGNLAALVPHKDQETLLRCAVEVLRARPEARFVIVGSGPLEASLKGLAKELGVGEAVRFTGFSEEPAAWLSSFDIFALSSWGEGMGSVLLEAMACGVPVVATSAGGIPEVISSGRTGLLVPPRDPAGLARAILEALGDPRKSSARAVAARESLKDFAAARTTRRMLEVYEAAVP